MQHIVVVSIRWNWVLIDAAESSVDVGEVVENGGHFSTGVVLFLVGEVERQMIDYRAEEDAVEILAQEAE